MVTETLSLSHCLFASQSRDHGLFFYKLFFAVHNLLNRAKFFGEKKKNTTPLIVNRRLLKSFNNAQFPVLAGEEIKQRILPLYSLYQGEIYGSCTLVGIKLLKWRALRINGKNLFSFFDGKYLNVIAKLRSLLYCDVNKVS